jgi:hypothetical protein
MSDNQSRLFLLLFNSKLRQFQPTFSKPQLRVLLSHTNLLSRYLDQFI